MADKNNSTRKLLLPENYSYPQIKLEALVEEPLVCGFNTPTVLDPKTAQRQITFEGAEVDRKTGEITEESLAEMREAAIIIISRAELEILFGEEPAVVTDCPPIFYLSG